MFAVLFGGAVALLPVFAKDILFVGPQGLGWLMAATYLGNFVAIAGLTSRPLKNKQGQTFVAIPRSAIQINSTVRNRFIHPLILFGRVSKTVRQQYAHARHELKVEN